MSMSFTRDGRRVEYDEKESDPNLQWIGDPALIAELRTELDKPSVTLRDSGLTIDLIEDNPAYNVTAAAMALGFDLVQAAPGTEAALDLDLTSFRTVLDDLLDGDGVSVDAPVSAAAADQWRFPVPDVSC